MKILKKELNPLCILLSNTCSYNCNLSLSLGVHWLGLRSPGIFRTGRPAIDPLSFLTSGDSSPEKLGGMENIGVFGRKSQKSCPLDLRETPFLIIEIGPV